jgi:tRNA threonylcarbamoyl adenosine modification protein YeaZ
MVRKFTLGIDATTPRLSFALVDQEKISGEFLFDQEAQSDNIYLIIKSFLEDQKISPREISRIVVVNGPGSFTGVRSALSFAAGFQSGSGEKDTELIALSSLLLPALGFLEQKKSAEFTSSFPARKSALGEDRFIAHYKVSAFPILITELKPPYLAASALDEDFRCEEYRAQNRAIDAVHLAAILFPDEVIPTGLSCQSIQFGKALAPIYGRPLEAKTLVERGITVSE